MIAMFAIALAVVSASCASGKCTEDVSLLQLRARSVEDVSLLQLRARSVDSIFDELEQEAVANVSTLLPDVTARDEREHRRHFRRFCRSSDCSDPATARKVFEGSEPADNERDARELDRDGVRVGDNAVTQGMSKWDMEKELCGWKEELDEVDPDTQLEMRLRAGGLRSSGKEDAEDLPEEFDPRNKWPECAHVIGAIRSQRVDGRGCGNCWANGAVSAFNDRVCIASRGRLSKILSVQHVSSCCPPYQVTEWSHYYGKTMTWTHNCKGINKQQENGNGCGGGGTLGVWKMAESTGIVTGGLYTSRGSGSTCWPNPLPTRPPECPASMAKGNTGKTSKRPYGCFEAGYPVNFDDDRHFAIPETYHTFPHDGTNGEGFWRRRSRAWHKWDKGKRDNTNYVPAIKRELMTHGSLAISMYVGCFGSKYKGGVIPCRRDCAGSGHAMRVIGWGRAGSKQYWLIANSWGTDWGEDGFLRVEIGCGYVGNFDASFVAPDAGRNWTSEPDDILEPTKQPTPDPTPAATSASAAFVLIADGSLPADEPGCSKDDGPPLKSSAQKFGSLDECAQLCIDTSGCEFFQLHENTFCAVFATCTLSRAAADYGSRAKVYARVPAPTTLDPTPAPTTLDPTPAPTTLDPTPAPTDVGALAMVLYKDKARCRGSGRFLEAGGTAESCQQKCLENAMCEFAMFKNNAKQKKTSCHSYVQCRTKSNGKFKVYKKK